MKEFLPNIYAVEVPKDAQKIMIEDYETHQYFSYEHECLDLTLKSSESLPEGKYEILGTITPTEIDFDVEPYLDGHYNFGKKYFKVYESEETFCPYKNTSFRSALTAAGITQFDKLVILRKI